MNLCQALMCEQVATHRVAEDRDSVVAIVVCGEHATYAHALNENVPKSRQVTVEPLGGAT